MRFDDFPLSKFRLGKFNRYLPNVDNSKPLRAHVAAKFSVKQYMNYLPLLLEDSPSFRYGFPTLSLYHEHSMNIATT
ncbi:MAG TPA: hypothetical protein H9796_08195 [Candidatus Butyricimonas faecavium]|nr:hypothetical protein [Candidatus Butyricimonas faecavium]